MERELELKRAVFQNMETKSHGGGGWLLQIGGEQPGWDQDVIGEVTMQDIICSAPVSCAGHQVREKLLGLRSLDCTVRLNVS